MLNPGLIPITELLGSLSPVVLLILVGSLAVILWEIVILLGGLIVGLRQKPPTKTVVL